MYICNCEPFYIVCCVDSLSLLGTTLLHLAIIYWWTQLDFSSLGQNEVFLEAS